jgi:hypothetical protein
MDNIYKMISVIAYCVDTDDTRKECLNAGKQSVIEENVLSASQKTSLFILWNFGICNQGQRKVLGGI